MNGETIPFIRGRVMVTSVAALIVYGIELLMSYLIFMWLLSFDVIHKLHNLHV